MHKLAPPSDDICSHAAFVKHIDDDRIILFIMYAQERWWLFVSFSQIRNKYRKTKATRSHSIIIHVDCHPSSRYLYNWANLRRHQGCDWRWTWGDKWWLERLHNIILHIFCIPSWAVESAWTRVDNNYNLVDTEPQQGIPEHQPWSRRNLNVFVDWSNNRSNRM